MARQDYSCIKENEEKSKEKNIANLLGGRIPEYRQISGPSLIFNSTILLVIYYLINCFVIYFYDKAKKKMTAKKKETLQIAIVIAIVLLLTLAVISYIYLLKLISLKFG